MRITNAIGIAGFFGVLLGSATIGYADDGYADDDDAIHHKSQNEKKNKAIQRGTELYDDLEYSAAIEILRNTLNTKNTKGLTADDQLTGYRILGLSLLAIGEENDARDAFRQLLERDRDFRFGAGENPRATQLLELVRIDLAKRVRFRHQVTPNPGQTSTAITLSLSIDDPSRVADQVIIRYRRPGATKWNKITQKVKGKDDVAVTIPGSLVVAPSLEYIITIEAIDGRVVATEDTPNTLTISDRPPSKKSVLRSPWLWAGVGAVLVTAATTYVILSRRPKTGFASIDTNVQILDRLHL